MADPTVDPASWHIEASGRGRAYVAQNDQHFTELKVDRAVVVQTHVHVCSDAYVEASGKYVWLKVLNSQLLKRCEDLEEKASAAYEAGWTDGAATYDSQLQQARDQHDRVKRQLRLAETARLKAEQLLAEANAREAERYQELIDPARFEQDREFDTFADYETAVAEDWDREIDQIDDALAQFGDRLRAIQDEMGVAPVAPYTADRVIEAEPEPAIAPEPEFPPYMTWPDPPASAEVFTATAATQPRVANDSEPKSETNSLVCAVWFLLACFPALMASLVLRLLFSQGVEPALIWSVPYTAGVAIVGLVMSLVGFFISGSFCKPGNGELVAGGAFICLIAIGLVAALVNPRDFGVVADIARFVLSQTGPA